MNGHDASNRNVQIDMVWCSDYWPSYTFYGTINKTSNLNKQNKVKSFFVYFWELGFRGELGRVHVCRLFIRLLFLDTNKMIKTWKTSLTEEKSSTTNSLDRRTGVAIKVWFTATVKMQNPESFSESNSGGRPLKNFGAGKAGRVFCLFVFQSKYQSKVKYFRPSLKQWLQIKWS